MATAARSQTPKRLLAARGEMRPDLTVPVRLQGFARSGVSRGDSTCAPRRSSWVQVEARPPRTRELEGGVPWISHAAAACSRFRAGKQEVRPSRASCGQEQGISVPAPALHGPPGFFQLTCRKNKATRIMTDYASCDDSALLATMPRVIGDVHDSCHRGTTRRHAQPAYGRPIAVHSNWWPVTVVMRRAVAGAASELAAADVALSSPRA